MDRRLVILLGTLSLAGCQNNGEPGFFDNLWYLDGSTVNGPMHSGAVSAKGISLMLTSDGKLSGNSACNRYFGSYRLVNGAAIEVAKLGSTKRACTGELMQAEGLYLNRLQKSNWIEQDGSTLKLYSDGYATPLVFTQKR
ncbi:META domain-containing protein [Gallaecimonas mangrovi]|uniref:META domain-containing protein n=1 Tax=Gallaecimonas mangrovi TaxID=2291597 RepID=UPI000E20A185|nr:META domain-containing protein [Gallaecimonas mangrovi]